MVQISVAEAAKRLGVRVQRVHQRIADGSLPAKRVGSQWVVDEADMLPLSDPPCPGRPLSSRSAWAVVALAGAQMSKDRDQASKWAPWLSALAPTERSRAKRRLEDLLVILPPDSSSAANAKAVRVLAARLRSLLRNRADRRLYTASPRDLDDVRGDDRLLLAGLSHPSSGLASGDNLEGYLARPHLDGLVEDYLLDDVVRDSDANVIVHVVDDLVDEWRPRSSGQSSWPPTWPSTVGFGRRPAPQTYFAHSPTLAPKARGRTARPPPRDGPLRRRGWATRADHDAGDVAGADRFLARADEPARTAE